MPEPLRIWLVSFTVDLARYLLAAGPAFLIFLVWGRRRFEHRSILGARPKLAKMLHDVRWSLSTVVLFSLVAVGVYYGARSGILRRYAEIGEHGWGWFALSIVILIVLQDTYFYWTHRAMHTRLLFKHVHRTHHVSTNPSPWTAYAFSPIEALVHAAFVPLVWFSLPLHEAAVFVFLAFMIVRNVLGHLSIELYPRGFTKSRFWRWHTTTTHHAMHHARFTSNFGLYFTFWDELMGTTHPAYSAAFERLTARERPDTRGQALPAART
jgi:sterol desaturase/sphingolipid hydroxylase (fatty acid hydroxylase superfamily)